MPQIFNHYIKKFSFKLVWQFLWPKVELKQVFWKSDDYSIGLTYDAYLNPPNKSVQSELQSKGIPQKLEEKTIL